MKYVNEVTIALPRDRVVALFDDVANLKHWQPGFVSCEPISGPPGQAGSTARLRYKMGRRDFEMVETVLRRALPDAFDVQYDSGGGGCTIVRSRFVAVSSNQTKWMGETEFRFRGIMKVFGFLFPGLFRRQSQKYLDAFKLWAETGKSASQA